jgi:hypothetical protein
MSEEISTPFNKKFAVEMELSELREDKSGKGSRVQ